MGAAIKGGGKLAAVLVYLLDHAGFMLELIDGILQLLVKNLAVGDNDNAVKNALVCCVMKVCQALGEPGNGIAFPRSG